MPVTILTRIEDCKKAWEDYWPARGLFDLWPVRESFHRAFQRPLLFVLHKEKGHVDGFLPLCLDEETGSYVMFPGETWHGKTWIEQNRILAASDEILSKMLNCVPGPVHLRYLLPAMPGIQKQVCQDETGYLFYPGLWDYSFNDYWLSFSGKHRKNLKAEIKRLEAGGITYQFDRPGDLDHLFQMNLAAFDRDSYFSDPRFQAAFEHLSSFLAKSGMIRTTTILVGGKIAAVDLGACCKNTYTLLAGGTSPEFPGIAKMINLHHLERACRERFNSVDFLCGDFNWKNRFRLTERPLFQLYHQTFVQANAKNNAHSLAAA